MKISQEALYADPGKVARAAAMGVDSAAELARELNISYWQARRVLKIIELLKKGEF
ncbi:MAG: hypothetical protein ABWU84_12795 [Pyrobaculum sp.]|uniref:hypothetical protein n=1 Tax=Pyrobaculum sp. TaxID=2004705 RepID=UPI003EECD176